MSSETKTTANVRPACGHRPARAGFTLIEMVGVLAVILIVASVVFTTSIRQMTLVSGQQESTNLANFASALQNSILRNRYIPGTNTANWSTNLAAELGVDSGTVSTNPYGWRRLLLADPALRIGGAGLPYTQTASGTACPTNARVMILSSLGLPLPNLTAADFTNIWNTADGTRPSGSAWTSWRGTTDDLRVQRIDLTPLFARLLLNNASTATRGSYSIDGGTTLTIPTNNVDAYFLQGTVLTLLAGTNSVDSKIILSPTTPSFVYQPPPPPSTNSSPINGDVLGATAAWFAASPANGRADGGITPTATMSAITNYMGSYVNWANAGFPSSGALHNAVVNANNQMENAMQDLVPRFSQGNCN